MKEFSKSIMADISRNIKQIRELKSYTQEYVASGLGISQPAYTKIEHGITILKIDRLQQIADILEVELSTLLNTTNIFNLVFDSTNQSRCINNQYITEFDMKILRKIIQEEINKTK